MVYGIVYVIVYCIDQVVLFLFVLSVYYDLYYWFYYYSMSQAIPSVFIIPLEFDCIIGWAGCIKMGLPYSNYILYILFKF